MSSILFIAPSAYIYGGLATWLDYLVPDLEDSGWDVTVGLVSGKYHDTGAYLSQHPFQKPIAIENSSGSREGRIRSICRAVRKVSPQLVVGVNITDTYAAVERLRLKKISDCKVAMTLHGFSPKLYDDMIRYSQLLDGVLCTNKLGCALAGQAGGIEKSRLHYAPYGVSIPEARPKSLDGKTLKIVYVGRLGENFQKRVTDIPGIVDFLDRANLNYELKIVGSGEEEALLREKMRVQISEKRVSFTGALFGDALSKIYDWANVILLTSFWETGPIVLWEAMARKVAVVS
ncbi:MAG: glycosyltransferase family 4 protein, partial [Candidatus Omnitrophota bacterium]